jgi:5'-3' exonuclease
MSQPWLIIDSHYLCHRAFHTTRGLSHKGIATGVMFGFLKGIAGFKDQFDTDKVAFCFEHPVLHRREHFSDYKVRRIAKDISHQDTQARIELREQIDKLRTEYLPKIGFKNVLCAYGMESDDLMAALAYALRLDNSECILITADSDLYQCLRDGISIYSPAKQKLLTKTWFQREYGFHPSKWAVVKAVAGCKSDGVPGIPGVGEITACKYVRGELLPNTPLHRFITSDTNRKLVCRNRTLVQLPFVGCPTPELHEDTISVEGWREVCAQLGMKSLAGRPPVASRRSVPGNSARTETRGK